MLVSDVFDATYAEWLYPAGINRPAYSLLATAIDSDDTSIVLDGRVSSVPRDTVLEIGSELILVSASAAETNTVTAQERGWLNTDAAAHSVGDIVNVDPKYPRKALFGALNTLLGDLYGQGVYQIATDTSQTYTSRGTVALASGGRRLLSARVDIGGSSFSRWRLLSPGRDYEEQSEFEPLEIQFRGGYETKPLKLVYVKAISQAAAEADDLDDLGVPSPLQAHLALGIAGRLLQARELPRVQIDEIKRQLSTQGIQVGAVLNIGQALLQQYRFEVQANRVRLDERRPHDIVLVR